MVDNLTDGYIYVDYSHVDNIAEDMTAQTQAIRSTLANLEMELNELKKSWVGDDADVYNDKQSTWDHAVEKMGTLLGSHRALLEQISQAWRYNEQSNAQSWSEVRIGR